MSESPDQAVAAPVKVRVTAADRGTEILLIDAAFAKVISGTGEVEQALAPGIYKARFKTGDRMEDKLFEVLDQPLTVHGGALEFSSPVPLAGCSNNHEYQFDPARELAAAAVANSDGTELLVFARDSAQHYGKPQSDVAPWAGFSLLDACGETVADIEQQGQSDSASGFVGFKRALPPGLYFLAQTDVALNRNLLLPVVLCRGWCTHVYVDSRDHAAGNRANAQPRQRLLDLAGSAIMMLHRDEPSGWSDDAFRLTEIARQGLMRDRKAVSTEDMGSMMGGNTRFPMLGLYAAHMLLARPEKDWPTICSIASHLHEWLGSSHPDVELLLRLCSRHMQMHRKARSYSLWPPMLASSWDHASAERAEPGGKLRSRGQLLRQYRLGGSMWSCLLLPPGTVLPGPAESTRHRRKMTATGGMTAMMRAIDVDKVALAALGSAAIAAAKAAVGRHISGATSAGAITAGRGSEDSDPWSLKTMLKGLTRPNPAHTPFQQALRRRVLDLTADDSNVSTRDVLHHLHDLARQFRLDKKEAIAAFHRMKTDALAALKDNVK